jgi:hypothetical protein
MAKRAPGKSRWHVVAQKEDRYQEVVQAEEGVGEDLRAGEDRD